jgi:hypothetical protein
VSLVVQQFSQLGIQYTIISCSYFELHEVVQSIHFDLLHSFLSRQTSLERSENMVPHPTPTPTVPALAARANTISYITVLPLTTIWTPSPSCLQATPTLKAGTCISGSCRMWSGAAEIGTAEYALLNPILWASGNSQTSTECAAPSSQQVIGFHYSPAVGCPADHSTVSSTRLYGGDVSAICCPS